MLQRATGVAQSRGAPNYGTEAGTIAQRSAQIEAQTLFKSYPPELAASIEKMPFGYLLPINIAKRIGNGFLGNSSTHIASGEVATLFNAANSFYGSISGFVAFSKSLGVQVGVIRDDYVSLDLILPSNVFDAKFSELAEKFKQFDRLFQAVSELAGMDRTSPIVYKASSSILATALIYSKEHFVTVLTTYGAILGAAEKTVRFYKTIVDVRSANLPPAAVKGIEDTQEVVINGYLEEAVNGLVDAAGSKVDPNRLNELRNELKIASRHAVQNVIEGARLSLSIENYNGNNLAKLPPDAVGGQSPLAYLQHTKQIENNIEAVKSGSADEIRRLTARGSDDEKK